MAKKTITECMLISKEFIPNMTKSWIQEDSGIPLHDPMHAQLDVTLESDPIFCWKIPRVMPAKQVDKKHMIFQADKRKHEIANILSANTDADEKYEQWSKCVEDCFQAALAQQAADKPLDFPKGLSKSMKGRGKYPERKIKEIKCSARPGRSGDYNSPPDIFTNLSRVKTRQVRRLDSLYKKLESRSNRGLAGQTPDTLLEWEAIKKSAGYPPNFVKWILDYSDLPSITENFPDLEELDSIRKWAKIDADNYHHKVCYRKRQDFKTMILKDWERGGKKTYTIVADRSQVTIQAMWIPCPFDALFLRWCSKGVARFRFPSTFRTLHEDEFWCCGHALKCVNSKENHVDLAIPKELQEVIRGWNQFIVHRWTHSSADMHEAFFQYWEKFWCRDPPLSEPDSDDWDATHALIRQLPQRPEIQIDIDVASLKEAIKTTKSHSARGLDGWHITELEAMPDSILQSLIDLCDWQARNSWAKVIGLTKVSLPPKNSKPFLPAHGRPICVLSQLYRVWAKIVASKVLSAFATWVPSSIIGGIPRRAASDVWYTLQLKVELAHKNKSAFHGFALDVQKCYNGIPRRQIVMLFQRVGLPAWLADGWLHFLGTVNRTVQINSSFSVPTHSTTGIPEGDPLSVPAMIAVCVLWDFYMKEGPKEGVLETWAYLDNLELTSDNIPDLCDGISKSWHFLKLWKLLPDIDKSWTWSVGTIRKNEQSLLKATSEHLGLLKHIPRAVDLGASLKYRGGIRISSIRDKFRDASARIFKLHGLPIALSQQWTVIQASSSAKALYALEIVPLGLAHFAKLRKKIATLISGCQKRNEFLTTALTHFPTVDPEVSAIKNCLRLFRRFLFMHHDMTEAVAKWLYEAPAETAKIKGPIGCLKRWFLRLGWTILPTGNLVTHDNIVLSLQFSCMKTIFGYIDEAWFGHVVTHEVSHRQGCGSLPCADLQSTGKIFNALEDKEQKIMAKWCSGGEIYGNQAAHWRSDESNKCDFCGKPDDPQHRFFHCEFFNELRKRHGDLLPWIEEFAFFWIYTPYIPLHPDIPLWRQRCSIPDHQHEAGYLWNSDDPMQFFFTDGSSYNSTCPHSCQSFWAIIWDAATSDEERRGQADGFLANGCTPTTLKTVQSGKVQGKQSIDRAELTAIIGVLAMAHWVHITSDSSYALNILEQAVNQVPLADFQRSANFDLISKLYTRVGDRGPNQICWKKIAAHTDLQAHQDLLTLYAALGNDLADKIAKECLERQPDDVQFIAHSIFSHGKLWSGQFSKFCKFCCEMTYEVSNFFKTKPQTMTQVDEVEYHVQLANWNFECPKTSYVIPQKPNWESNFLYGERFMLTLKVWLESIQWPSELVQGCPGITWMEMFVDFVIATGLRIPTRVGLHEGQPIFERTQGSTLLKQNTLQEQINHFRSAIRAVAYQANCEVFPFSSGCTKCKTLLPFQGGRPQSGLSTRPILTSPTFTMETINNFHVAGRGSHDKLATKMDIPLNCAVIPMPLVDDSSFEARISNFNLSRYRNCAHRARCRKRTESQGNL